MPDELPPLEGKFVVMELMMALLLKHFQLVGGPS